jgi:hypothetical protein
MPTLESLWTDPGPVEIETGKILAQPIGIVAG